MNGLLDPNDVESLFSAAVDGEMTDAQRAEFEAVLRADAKLKARFDRYSGAVSLLRGAPKETPPPSLASAIMRRVRRNRSLSRRTRAAEQVAFRVPAELLVPLLIAVAVAVLLAFWAI